jgi:hypothetical protein
VTYTLGLVGMLQAVLLPGLCLTLCLNSWNWPQRLLFAPPLSLLLNYYLVWALSSAGLYGQASILGLLALEIAWIAFRTRRSPPAISTYEPLDRWIEPLFLLLAVAALTKYTQAWVRDFGDVFQLWDAVVSWNAWARDWFHNTRPSSNLYPHALPIAFSLPYAFMGNSALEMFSKATIGLIYLSGLGALIELGFRRKDLRLTAWVCAFLFSSIQARFMQSHWNSGYADIPLSLMPLFAFCISFMTGKETPWIFGLISGTAPLVKQPGLLIAALSPLLYRGWKPLRSSLKPVALPAIIAAGPWYLFIASTIYLLKRESNNVGYLSNLVPGGPLERWSVTLNLLVHYAGAPYLIAYLILSTWGVLVSKDARRWWLYLGLPYFLIWGTFFAYDIRNLSMALFPLALSVSAAVSFLAEKIQTRLPAMRVQESWRRFVSPVFLGRSIVAVTIVLGLVASKRPIQHWLQQGSAHAWEEKQRLALGDAPKANEFFAELISCQQSTGTRFLTNYWWPTVIPQIRGAVESVNCEQIRETLNKKKSAYIYLRTPDCDLLGIQHHELYAESDFRILTGNSSLANGCKKGD